MGGRVGVTYRCNCLCRSGLPGGAFWHGFCQRERRAFGTQQHAPAHVVARPALLCIPVTNAHPTRSRACVPRPRRNRGHRAPGNVTALDSVSGLYVQAKAFGGGRGGPALGATLSSSPSQSQEKKQPAEGHREENQHRRLDRCHVSSASAPRHSRRGAGPPNFLLLSARGKEGVVTYLR